MTRPSQTFQWRRWTRCGQGTHPHSCHWSVVNKQTSPHQSTLWKLGLNQSIHMLTLISQHKKEFNLCRIGPEVDHPSVCCKVITLWRFRVCVSKNFSVITQSQISPKGVRATVNTMSWESEGSNYYGIPSNGVQQNQMVEYSLWTLQKRHRTIVLY